jgi:hypothetical protein
MAVREHDKQALAPEVRDVAIGSLMRVRDERNIKAPPANQCSPRSIATGGITLSFAFLGALARRLGLST